MTRSALAETGKHDRINKITQRKAARPGDVLCGEQWVARLTLVVRLMATVAKAAHTKSRGGIVGPTMWEE